MPLYFQEGVGFSAQTRQWAYRAILALPENHALRRAVSYQRYEDESWHENYLARNPNLREAYVWNDWHTSQDPQLHLTLIVFYSLRGGPRSARQVWHMYRDGRVAPQGMNSATSVMSR